MKFLAFTFIVLAQSSFADDSFMRGYRVLHASPNEIVSALNSPLKGPLKGKTANSPTPLAGSRLQKYFRIRKKAALGESVLLEVSPQFPLTGNDFADVNFVTLKFTPTARAENSYTYDVKIGTSPDKFIDTTMIIEPNISGSLLTLQLNSTSLLAKAFSQIALSLGFLEKTAQAAELKEK